MPKVESFSNRWGIVLAALGMAIGAGNLWRFPRLAGQYGGTFIVLWILFLFIWSIPLLLTEFAIGKKFRRGVIGSFASLAGERYTWMGFFVTVCTLGIAFYYSIVTAWSLQYLRISVSNLLSDQPLAERLAANPDLMQSQWEGIANGSLTTIVLYIVVVLAGVLLLKRGIKRGLEAANKILIPSLFVLIVIIAVIALSMPKGIAGLSYMFEIKWELFGDAKVWIEALSQSAWSTGAGWGLMMTLSSFTREKEDVTLNTFIGAFGNNTASLVAGIAILPAVFALAASDEEALTFLQAGNQALTFTIIPKLFSTINGGAFLAILFFLALFFAAFSSLLPMIELFVSNISNMGIRSKYITPIVAVSFIVFGFPSAYSLDFFNNQDWVWGVGLILSGFFILFAVAKYGPGRFKEEFIDEDSDFRVWTGYFSWSTRINLFMAIFLVYWWLSQGYSAYPWFNEAGYWNVWDVYSNASVISQWLLVLILGIIINRWLHQKFVAQTLKI
ncbi:MAG: sodium-dependent transporter [Bacteroidota bacterium]